MKRTQKTELGREMGEAKNWEKCGGKKLLNMCIQTVLVPKSFKGTGTKLTVDAVDAVGCRSRSRSGRALRGTFRKQPPIKECALDVRARRCGKDKRLDGTPIGFSGGNG